MAVRYCPNCFKNVVVIPLTSKCSDCQRPGTLPLDKKLTIPEDKYRHSRFKHSRQYLKGKNG
jgi:hypothetical protein